MILLRQRFAKVWCGVRCRRSVFRDSSNSKGLMAAEWLRRSTAGRSTSDAGTVLLREADRAIGLIERVAACFTDHREAEQVVHALPTLIGQRIVAIALGYEDINDHDDLRRDPVLALFSDKLEAKREDCAALAGKSTLNRLEHAPRRVATATTRSATTRRRSSASSLILFLEAYVRRPSGSSWTSTPPTTRSTATSSAASSTATTTLLLSAALHLLRRSSALRELRPSDIDAAAGVKDEVTRIVARSGGAGRR